ncbi:alpha/beta fold hydrolase [Streptomyces chartreusis]
MPRLGFLQRPDGAHLALYTTDPATTPDLTVVLAHGWSASARIWTGYAGAMHARDDRLRVVAFDQRGHGASTPGTRPASMRLLARDLQAVITTAAQHTPVVVAGHSMGGMALLSLVAHAPDLLGHPVAGVLLAATSGGQLDLTARTYPPLTRALGATRHAIAAFCLHAPHPAQHLRDLLRPPTAPRPAIDVAAHYYRAVTAHDVTGRLGPLAGVPVHIVTGDADRLIPPVHSLRLAAQISTSRLHVIPNAGHRLPTDHPDTLLEILGALCAQARAPAASQLRS